MVVNSEHAARAHRDETGQGMVEYGLIVGLISIVVVAVFVSLAPAISDMFTEATASDTLQEGQYQVSQAVNDS